MPHQAFGGAALILLFVAISFSAAIWFSLRAGETSQGRIAFSGFDGIGVLVAFTAFVCVSVLFGPLVSGCVLAALFFNELGHALARRTLGHENAELRLFPVPFLRNSAQAPSHDPLEESYIALMGAGLSIAPMVMGFAATQLLIGVDADLANAALTFAVTMGAVNFIMLLPFVPLDGGRCVRAFSNGFWPALSPTLSAFMVAAFLSAAWRSGSVAFFILAGIGLQSLIPRKTPDHAPLSPNNALLILGAYAFTLAAHFCGGWWLIKGLI